MFQSPDAIGRSRRTARIIAAAGGGTAAVTQAVANGPVGSLGEPAAAQDSAASAVVVVGFRLGPVRLVAASQDGGRTFGAPVAMPVDGGDAAFGVRRVRADRQPHPGRYGRIGCFDPL